MTSARMAYLSGAFGSFAARGMTLVAGVLALWFLTRILSVDDFAGYASAMAVIVLLGYNAGFGLERAMLLRVSGQEPAKRQLLGTRLMLRILGATVLLAGGLAAAIALALMARPGLLGDGRMGLGFSRFCQ